MNKTTYTKQTYVIRDNNGNYLKEGSDNPSDPIFIENETEARTFGYIQAQAYAGRINERYIAKGIYDVWGAPKRVIVHKMTISTVVEPILAPHPKQTITNIEWYDYTEENLLEVYKDYVEEIEKDKDLHIVTNVLCMAK